MRACVRPKAFLSTLSLRRATFGENHFGVVTHISIHALLAESDHPRLRHQPGLQHFYPRSPCGERRYPVEVTGQSFRFLSTLSLRRATAVSRVLFTPVQKFLSTLSLRRATQILGCLAYLQSYFYPRSPCGERPAQAAGHSRRKVNFYPRSPCGERRQITGDNVVCTVISIHALLAESDMQSLCGMVISLRFLSTLSLRRATIMRVSVSGFSSKFLSTLSLRRATISIAQINAGRNSYFYPRSPCGERHCMKRYDSKEETFLSTLSLRRATTHAIFCAPKTAFLSTLSLRRATNQPADNGKA